MASVPGVKMSTGELRERVLELGRRQSALVEEGTSNAYNGTADPRVKRAALSWGLKALPDVQEATLHTDPLVALGDLWALSLQTQTFVRTGPGRERLGDAAIHVERAADQMVRESEEVAALVLGADGLAGPRGRVQNWAAAHPITSGTFARPSASVAWAAAMGGNQSRGALGFLASTDDRLSQMAARIEMMNQTMLDRVRWTSELVVQDALGKENITGMIDEVRLMVAQQQENLMRDLDDQRQQLFADLAKQRSAVFRDIAFERAAIFTSVAGERAAITARADELLQGVNTSARGLLHGTLLRLGLGAAALIVLAAAAAWFVVHALRRRPEGPRRTRLEPAPGPAT
jgi:hypothetical protein